MVSQMEDFTSSRAFRLTGPKAFAEAGISHKDVDHLMIYDGFAHLPIYGLEDWALCRATRPEPSSPSATPPPAASCRSTPMAAAYRPFRLSTLI
jgi:hypothetical protein